MHQEPSYDIPKQTVFSPTSPYSSTTTHHNHSMSTDSTSPILQSTSSLSAEDDNYQFSSPVNETDEIILRRGYFTGENHDEDGTSLWHDLDRDGVNTPAIPSFILNSPSMGPMRFGEEYKGGQSSEVTIHSLRKGILFGQVGLMIGCDPKVFFGETVHGGNLNAENSLPDVGFLASDPAIIQYSTRGYNSDAPISVSLNESPLWSTKTTDISVYKYSPVQGPWGIIPSRSVMISNLPKTTQLWTLVELLKVNSSLSVANGRVLAIGRGFSQKEFPLMDLQLSRSMTCVMHYVVFVIFVRIISLQIVGLTHISFPSLLSLR